MIEKLTAYSRLLRLHKPIGIFLLLWPTLTAVWLAANGKPPWTTVVIFTVGVFIMRSAGCAINDLADRHFDGFVARTAQRPLATRVITSQEALIIAGILVILAFIIAIPLQMSTLLCTPMALGLAILYPFCKRWLQFPQAILGLAFSCGIIMAFVELQGRISMGTGWLFVANACWVLAYDTQYAMVDRSDDLKIGVKSTAIWFGRYDNRIILLLQIIYLVCLFKVSSYYSLKDVYYCSLIIVLGLFIYQQVLTHTRVPARCFQAFLNNHWVGLVVFLGVALDLKRAELFSF